MEKSLSTRDLFILQKKKNLPGSDKSSTLNTQKNTISETVEIQTEKDEEENFEHLDKEYTPSEEPVKKKTSFFHLIGKLLLFIIQAITALCLLPLGICVLILGILFGVEIYLVIAGSSIIGFTLITVALMILISEISSFIWKLVGKSKRKLSSYGLRILFCAILFGTGSVLAVKEFSDFQIMDSPLMMQDTKTQSYTLSLPDVPSSLILGTTDIDIVTNNSLSKDEILIHQTVPKEFQSSELTQIDDVYFLNSWIDPSDEFQWVQNVIHVTFEGLKENILYQYSVNELIYVMIEVHPESLNRITVHGLEVQIK